MIFWFPLVMCLSTCDLLRAARPSSLHLTKDVNVKFRRAVEELKAVRWPDNIVPYIFHPRLGGKGRSKVKEVMQKFESITCIRFDDRTNDMEADDPDHHKLHIFNYKPGCWAEIGYSDHYLTRRLNLEKPCISPSGNYIAHELLHSLGFHHTQNRFDRDKYVKVNFENIIKGKENNYKKSVGQVAFLAMLGIPYDYSSIMHYGTDGFTSNRQPTMRIKRPFPGVVGRSKSFSRNDVAAVNRLYECWDHYLGDDIPGAVPYRTWFDLVFKQE